MKFKKYSSIENVSKKEVEKIQTLFFDEIFVVQEKIHGANYSIISDGVLVKNAKRSGIISKDENFYNNHRISYLDDIILNMAKSLGKSVCVYGEICGGTYPHTDVESLGIKGIQKGTYYSNDIQFFAFDISIDDSLVNMDEFKTLCIQHNIPFLDFIYEGDLNSCLEVSNEYNSTIPKKLGLPELDSNICEGNVIKPKNPLKFGNGDRVILKYKNSKFKEKNESEKVKVQLELPEEVKSTIENLSQYVNENRLRNVISKIGTITRSDIGKLIGMLSCDAISEFEKDDHSLKLYGENRKHITKFINNLSSKLVVSNISKIIDGEF